MTPAWHILDTELAEWQAQGLTLPLWWRDDDAVAATSQLTRLLHLAETLDMPAHLAVIPAHARDSLAKTVTGTPYLIPLAHGWAHENHAPAPEKKAEFGPHRPVPEMLDQARRSLETLSSFFGDRLQPVFVPPWNRIAPNVTAGLAAVGFTTLSTFTPRHAPEVAPGLAQINTHLDPIDWKGTRSLSPPDRLIAQIAGQLRDRRTGHADAAEPYGILTHHLVHDAAIWQFTQDLLTRLLNGPAHPATLTPKGPDQ